MSAGAKRLGTLCLMNWITQPSQWVYAASKWQYTAAGGKVQVRWVSSWYEASRITI